MTTEPLRVIAYGAGIQSTALLVLAATGRIDYRTFLFANVGDDSEHPDTLAYLADVAAPYAAAQGIDLHQLARRRRDGTTETLWGRLMAPESRSLPIPVRMSNGAPGTRSCTADFKIRVIGKWVKAHGATAGKVCKAHHAADFAGDVDCRSPHFNRPRRDCPKCVQPNVATVGIGISLDEIERANNRRVEPHETIAYPLLDLRLRRTDCQRVITDAGLPVPPKSACFFCPFHRAGAWEDIARDRPDLFAKSCELEDTLNGRRAKLGKDPVFLTRYGIPLRDAISGAQQTLPLVDDGGCDSGWCMT